MQGEKSGGRKRDRPGPSHRRDSSESPKAGPIEKEKEEDPFPVLMQLINRQDTPTPMPLPPPNRRRRLSSGAEDDEPIPLVYTSIVDLTRRTVPASVYGLGSTPFVGDYKKGKKLGQGTYGTVYEGQHLQTGEIVALKRMKVKSSQSEAVGVPPSVIREIMVLKKLSHENIIKCKGTVAPRAYDGILMVMELCETDLSLLLNDMRHPFESSQVKCVMTQLLSAVEHIHKYQYLHRDIKSSNILLTSEGVIKLADFGLARPFHTEIEMTPRVVTLWYRSMELLLHSPTQNHGVDMWSVGCILAELLQHEALFRAESELKMIHCIIEVLGVPTVEIWEDLPTMPALEHFELKGQHVNRLAKLFESHSLEAIDLMQQCFIYDPVKRISASEALKHPYFHTAPRACHPSLLPIFPQAGAARPSSSRRSRHE